jgi:type VI secretion system protein ImpI
MILTLEIVGEQVEEFGARGRKVFHGVGGTIGRLPDNDWVFPDPYVSGRHALIRYVSGKFFVEDTSTNGVYLNSPDNRLIKAQPHPLKDGDLLYIDAYRVNVSIENDADLDENDTLGMLKDAAVRRPAVATPAKPAAAAPLAPVARVPQGPASKPPAPDATVFVPAEDDHTVGMYTGLGDDKTEWTGSASQPAFDANKTEWVAAAKPSVSDDNKTEWLSPAKVKAKAPPADDHGAKWPAAAATPANDPNQTEWMPGKPAARDDNKTQWMAPATPKAPIVDDNRTEWMSSSAKPAVDPNQTEWIAPGKPAVQDDNKTQWMAPVKAKASIADDKTEWMSPARKAPLDSDRTEWSGVPNTPRDDNKTEWFGSKVVEPRPESTADVPLAPAPRPTAPVVTAAAPPASPAKVSSAAAMRPPFAEPVQRAAAPAQDSAPKREPVASRVPSRSAAGSGDEAMMRQVLAAAGIEGVEPTAELAETIGAILRIAVSGMMEVQRARERLKDELRVRGTIFKPAHNNPLKFSANVDDAFHNLLLKHNAAYLDPTTAFADAFNDLRDHHAAILSALRLAFESMLAQFDPARMQDEFDRHMKKGSILGVPVKLRYWELYRDRYGDMVKDADTSFRHLFGEKFAVEYEEQLERLKSQYRDREQ